VGAFGLKLPTTKMERQVENLKKQRAFAWAKYYSEMAAEADNARVIIQYVNIAHGAPTTAEYLPPHITQEFYEMAVQLRRKFECPVCLEVVNKDTIQITHCGHVYCKPCIETLKTGADPKCAVCRRKI